jgi:RNA polymerase sigma-70 factor (ECF subfamily)
MADHFFREFSGIMVATLSRKFGLQHIELITDIVQDAFVKALQHWRYKGLPENPEAWLMRVAMNLSINRINKESRIHLVDHFIDVDHSGYSDAVEDQSANQDDQLRLLLACCDSRLHEKAKIALTLHILCGFGLSEIANALLMNPEAVKKMLYRAKQVLKENDIILRGKTIEIDSERFETMCTVIYLMFNEGYNSSTSETTIDESLCYEAIRLSRLVISTEIPQKAEVFALLALMYFNVARFETRTGSLGEIIALPEQDRSLWDKELIGQGYHYLHNAKPTLNYSRYYIEALIASLHVSALRFEETRWDEIVRLYSLLFDITTSPIARLSYYVAMGYDGNSSKALQQFTSDQQLSKMTNHYLYHATHAQLLEQAGRYEESLTAYHLAIKEAPRHREKEYLTLRCINVRF